MPSEEAVSRETVSSGLWEDLVPDVVAQLKEYRTNVLEGWTDDRLVPREWVDTHIWFFLHLYADMSQCGAVVLGYSFRESEDDTLLVLRVLREGIRQVVFAGSTDATHCMSKLRRQLEAGTVRWVDDKYQ